MPVRSGPVGPSASDAHVSAARLVRRSSSPALADPITSPSGARSRGTLRRDAREAALPPSRARAEVALARRALGVVEPERTSAISPAARRRVALQVAPRASLGGAPADLDAVVGVVGHLQRRPARQQIGDGQLLRRAVAARVGDAARRDRGCACSLAISARTASGLRPPSLKSSGCLTIRSGSPEQHVHRDEQAHVARRRRVVLPRPGGLEDLRAVGHRDRPAALSPSGTSRRCRPSRRAP